MSAASLAVPSRTSCRGSRRTASSASGSPRWWRGCLHSPYRSGDPCCDDGSLPLHPQVLGVLGDRRPELVINLITVLHQPGTRVVGPRHHRLLNSTHLYVTAERLLQFFWHFSLHLTE